MALLASKTLRKTFASQIFGHGSSSHNPIIIGFAKTDVMMPGTYASFLGREFSQHDYMNTVLNWSTNDGAGGANRQYYLGFCVLPSNSSNTNVYADENGAYIIGDLPITMVSEGTIGSAFVWLAGRMYSTNTFTPGTGTIQSPISSVSDFGANLIAAAESVTPANFNFGVSTGTSSGFNGTSYVYRVASNLNQKECETSLYNKMIMITDSVGTASDKIVKVSSMSITTGTTTYLNSIKINIKEVL